MNVILEERGISKTLEGLADEIAEAIPDGCAVGVIGIRARGDDLARRLIGLLEARGVRDIASGVLDITMYRDDLAEIGPSAVVRTTEIAFDVEGRFIILVDDVIHTGRSIRAALAAIIDLGRPKSIRLCVLVDRGGRELPIQPDFAGIRCDHGEGHVNVRLEESDGVDRVEAGT